MIGLFLLPAALAHSPGEGPQRDSHGGGHKGHTKSADTYFALSEHASVMYAHIAVMTIAWVMVLPVGMLNAPSLT
jgi:hypothetical protein